MGFGVQGMLLAVVRSLLACVSGVSRLQVSEECGFVELCGFRVQGSGLRAQGSGFRVQSSGFRV